MRCKNDGPGVRTQDDTFVVATDCVVKAINLQEGIFSADRSAGVRYLMTRLICGGTFGSKQSGGRRAESSGSDKHISQWLNVSFGSTLHNVQGTQRCNGAVQPSSPHVRRLVQSRGDGVLLDKQPVRTRSSSDARWASPQQVLIMSPPNYSSDSCHLCESVATETSPSFP